MFIIMIFILILKTKVVNFSNDFGPAALNPHPPVYMNCTPRGNLGHGMILRIKKSLYGQTEAPRPWFEKLVKGLEDRGFKSSNADTFMFFSDKLICLVYQ